MSDATLALAYLAKKREEIARKYAKEMWVVNFNYFLSMNGLSTSALDRMVGAPPRWEAEPQFSINYTLLREHLLKKYNEDRLQNAFNAAVVVYDTEAHERFEAAAMEQGFVMSE